MVENEIHRATTPEAPVYLRHNLRSNAVLIVGAGFAGATYARELAESGFTVHIIDQRPHIAGNAHDQVLRTGVRVHTYGPHLFHTSNKNVVDWLLRFGRFVDYRHKVQAELPGNVFVPLPINRRTLEIVFNVTLEDESAVKSLISRQSEAIESPANAAEYLRASIGLMLTDLFFRPYTKKMWDMDLEDLDADVVRRIPLRTDDEDHYFPGDKYQMLPERGYTDLFESILDHPNISVNISQKFEKAMLPGYRHCFNSMPIDEFFDYSLGPLPYRSIRFLNKEVPSEYQYGDAATINFTDPGPLTRQTDWSRLPCHREKPHLTKTITQEQPCDYRENNLERYYPVKTSDGRYNKVYSQYQDIAKGIDKLTFIGRCGTYQYLDMHQVINQSLAGARSWLRNRG